MNATAWTVLGVLGTAAAGAIITKLVSKVFEWSSRLKVQVTVNQSFKVPSMFEEFKSLQMKATTLDERLNSSDSIFGKNYQFFNSETYLRYELKNNSSKKLGGLTLCAHSVGSALVQVGDGLLVEIKSDVPHLLGDLQPKRELIVHILLGSLPGVHTIKEIKSRVTFSADELGRVAYKFPWPSYLKNRFRDWTGNLFFLIAILTILAGFAAKMFF